jgi:hypothetical protein
MVGRLSLRSLQDGLVALPFFEVVYRAQILQQARLGRAADLPLDGRQVEVLRSGEGTVEIEKHRRHAKRRTRAKERAVILACAMYPQSVLALAVH